MVSLYNLVKLYESHAVLQVGHYYGNIAFYPV